MRKDCDYVIRYEYLAEDVDSIFPGLKVPPVSVSHPGQWYAEDDKYLMTNKTKDIIEYFCMDDIKEFNYKYDGKTC